MGYYYGAAAHADRARQPRLPRSGGIPPGQFQGPGRKPGRRGGPWARARAHLHHTGPQEHDAVPLRRVEVLEVRRHGVMFHHQSGPPQLAASVQVLGPEKVAGRQAARLPVRHVPRPLCRRALKPSGQCGTRATNAQEQHGRGTRKITRIDTTLCEVRGVLGPAQEQASDEVPSARRFRPARGAVVHRACSRAPVEPPPSARGHADGIRPFSALVRRPTRASDGDGVQPGAGLETPHYAASPSRARRIPGLDTCVHRWAWELRIEPPRSRLRR